MAAISLLYGAAIRGRNALYDAGMIRAERLAGPVVSIGNISTGGSGKTPFVICLGELLKQRGIKFDVLSRGYRRQTQGVAIVDPAGTAAEFGDEPLLIARRLGVPVVVGESRYAAGLEAEKRFGQQMHLLDDGFQHRELARNFDIVLVTAPDLLDRMLPLGTTARAVEFAQSRRCDCRSRRDCDSRQRRLRQAAVAGAQGHRSERRDQADQLFSAELRGRSFSSRSCRSWACSPRQRSSSAITRNTVTHRSSDCCRRNPHRWPMDSLLLKKMS